MKKITKQITLTYDIRDDKLVFSDLRTLCLALGTSSVSGNLSVYGVEKKDGEYYVSVDKIKERIKKKQERLDKEQEYLDIMKQLIEQMEE